MWCVLYLHMLFVHGFYPATNHPYSHAYRATNEQNFTSNVWVVLLPSHVENVSHFGLHNQWYALTVAPSFSYCWTAARTCMDIFTVLPEKTNKHFLFGILPFCCVTRCRKILGTYFLNAPHNILEFNLLKIKHFLLISFFFCVLQVNPLNYISFCPGNSYLMSKLHP